MLAIARECAEFCEEDFALTEASYLIIRLLQEFSTIRVARTDPMRGMCGADERLRLGLVIKSADGCLIELERWA
jgi:hypothetical protein